MDSKLALVGETKTIELPSTRKVIIRETNGDDEEVLSKVSGILDGSNVCNFLAGIIIEDLGTKQKPSPGDIAEWLLADKYYLLYEQRIFNQGNELVFEHKCLNDSCSKHKPQEYIEDLSLFEPNKETFKYPLGAALERELSLPSGKKIKYKLRTGIFERKSLDVPDSNLNKNTDLINREIQLFSQSKYLNLFNFKDFSSREMAFIRTDIRKHDLDFAPTVSFKCNYCGTPYSLGLLALPAFFYPEGTI